MVYLIDDKKSRQELDYSWTIEKFKSFSNVLTCIYTLEELHEKAVDIFSENNIILYHESFLDQTYLSKEAIDKREKINNWSKNKKNSIVYFSGSKNTREIKDNIAYIPVSILYSNLEVFLNKYEQNDYNLNYLLFGEKVDIEKELNQKQDEFLSHTFDDEAVDSITPTFFIRPFKKYISNPFVKFKEGIFFSDVTNEKISEKVDEWFKDEKFDNIFLPLCFGEILSDFNGLRLATHIRCTKNINQLTNIYIYGFVGIEYLLQNEYFDILKTKNVFLVPFSKKSFLEYINQNKGTFYIENIADEIKKMNLHIPKNYEDSHSITNEWAIYRWSSFIGIELSTEIKTVFENIQSNIYFKYLNTIHPIYTNDILPTNIFKIKNNHNLNVLLIDDEVNKGWGKIFSSLLFGLHKVKFDYIGDNFKTKKSDDIVIESLNKIINDDIDIVILDFRLTNEDFSQVNPLNITSLKLLKKIKKFNPGIQVIIFSATNKIWNYNNLQNAGADHFILKESPSINMDFSNSTLKDLVHSISVSSKMSFLKKLYFKINNIKSFYINDETEFAVRLKNNLNIAYKLLVDTKKSIKYFNYAFLQLFQIIEDYCKLPYVFKEDMDCFVYVNNKEICVYKSLKDGWETAISFTNKYKLGKTFYSGELKRKRLEINYIVSAILIFRLGYENSSALEWTKINNIRNTKAAHFNIEDSLNENDIVTILNFIYDFIDPSNQNESNIDKGLKIKTLDESLEYLKNKYR